MKNLLPFLSDQHERFPQIHLCSIGPNDEDSLLISGAFRMYAIGRQRNYLHLRIFGNCLSCF